MPGATEKARNFQSIILDLQAFWADKGCVILQPYDMEVGAGTFHPATTLRALGPQAWKAAYVQPSRRPTDGRYGENPNRLQHYYQFQVLWKPSPSDSQGLYLESLAAIGIDLAKHDIRFVEDDWESPTLGAWGLGWEVWCDGMEVSQFTYFQQVGGIECNPVSLELTYGLERLAMYIQGVENVYDLDWNGEMTYGDVYLRNEQEQSAFNFEHSNTEILFRQFTDAETLSFYKLPWNHRKNLKSSNVIERLNEEIRRRTDVLRIFPNDASCLRLIRALAVEQHEEWQEGSRYLNMELLKEHKKMLLNKKVNAA